MVVLVGIGVFEGNYRGEVVASGADWRSEERAVVVFLGFHNAELIVVENYGSFVGDFEIFHIAHEDEVMQEVNDWLAIEIKGVQFSRGGVEQQHKDELIGIDGLELYFVVILIFEVYAEIMLEY